MKSKTDYVQLIWGAALVLAGMGVFVYVIPQRIPEIIEYRNISSSSFDVLFTYFCFGLIGIVLCIGGAKKIYKYGRDNGKTEKE